jgi:hypothetical protein
MVAADPAHGPSDVQRQVFPIILNLALDDSDEVSRGAILAFSQLVALLPRHAAAAAAQSAIHKLESQGTEEAAVQAARVFAHAAASWSEATLQERAPELLRRWCSHRYFTVREAMACCMSLVGEHLPLGGWQAALLPWFSQLCRDNNWRVRRAAALDLPRLAGALHRHQQRVLPRADSTCSCSTGSSDEANNGGSAPSPCSACACGRSCARSSDCGAAAHCRISGVAVDPVGADQIGACANMQREPATGYGTRPGEGRRRHEQMAAIGSSVWTTHVMRQAAPPSGSGGARSMGKHPLSSSLLIDKPESSESASSSLSSDDRPLASSPTGSDSPVAGDSGSAAAAEAAAARVQPISAVAVDGSAECDGEVGLDEEEPRPHAEPPPPCAFALDYPALHACWAALRECVDCVTTDSSHWVKVTALSGLGPCLLALPACQLSGLLVGRYVGMGSSTTVIYEISVALACAQSFGLVASRLGPQRWPDLRCAVFDWAGHGFLCLLNGAVFLNPTSLPPDHTPSTPTKPLHPPPPRPAFNHMQVSRDPNVLQELVTALPLMAQHLGGDILRTSLLPSLLSIIQNHLSWVDAALVTAIPPLLEALPAASHEPLLRVVSKLAQGAANSERCRAWRLRREIATQLGRLAHASPQATITDVLWPAAISLCSDPVAAVRSAAAAEVGPLLAALLPMVQHQQAAGGCEGQAQQAAAHDNSKQPAGGLDQAQRGQRGELVLLNKQGASPSSPSAARDQAWRTPGVGGSDADAEDAGHVSGSDSDEGEETRGPAGAATGLDASMSALTAALGSPRHSSGGGSGSAGVYGSYGSSTSEECDDAERFGCFPCALAAPPCGGLPESSPPHDVCEDLAAGLDAATDGRSSGDEGSSGTGASSGVESSSGASDDSSDSEASGDESAAPAALPMARTPIHPAMMHPAMALHPAMAPVGTWGRPPKPSPKRSVSTGTLPVSRRAQVAAAANLRRRSSTSRLSQAEKTQAPAGLDPLCVAPSQYVDSLIDRFARSSTFQGRQLFVAMSLGLLAHAAPLLPVKKREMVTAALEALARDEVSSVRIVAQSAAAALHAAAAESTRDPPAEAKEQEQQQQKPKQQRPLPPLPMAPSSQAAAKASTHSAPSSSGDDKGSGQGAGVGFDATLLSSHSHLLRSARALVRENPGGLEAAAAALRAHHSLVHGGASSVPIQINSHSLPV